LQHKSRELTQRKVRALLNTVSLTSSGFQFERIPAQHQIRASLCEWLDIPGGISAQIQGHAPQGVREKNYIRRPLDLLRVHHEKIEAWILKEAGIDFDPAKAAAAGLRVVA
jgi:hypothetical protein